MKKITLKFALLAVILVFSSCSNDDVDVAGEKEPAMGTLSFGAMLNGINENRSNHLNGIPDCSEDAPAYVEVIMSGTTNVGTEAAPEVIAFTPTPADNDGDGQDEYFTEAILDLEAGNYTLESFNVYDADDNLIWVAPENSGSFAEFVNNPLPLSITVEADVENYTVVDVLCFDNRELDAYGNLVFGLNENKALEYCFSAEYCSENGGDPASVSVNIWLGNDANGTELYSGVMNDLTSTEGDAVCFALPDLAQYTDEEKYLYYEVTIQDHPDTYGDVEQAVISGTLSRADIQANFVGETHINAEELIFACDEGEVTDPGNGLAVGEYVFEFDSEADLDWFSQQNSTYQVSGSQLNVTFDPVQFDGTSKRRADLAYSINGSVNGEPQDDWVYNEAFLIFAVKINKPASGNMFPDAGLDWPGSNWFKTDYEAQNVYFWDFSERISSADTDANGLLTTNVFQVKMADITSEETGYSVDWIRTFASAEELATFLQNN